MQRISCIRVCCPGHWYSASGARVAAGQLIVHRGPEQQDKRNKVTRSTLREQITNTDSKTRSQPPIIACFLTSRLFDLGWGRLYVTQHLVINVHLEGQWPMLNYSLRLTTQNSINKTAARDEGQRARHVSYYPNLQGKTLPYLSHAG